MTQMSYFTMMIDICHADPGAIRARLDLWE